MAAKSVGNLHIALDQAENMPGIVKLSSFSIIN